jgi:hypothetical protein
MGPDLSVTQAEPIQELDAEDGVARLFFFWVNDEKTICTMLRMRAPSR